MKKLTVTALSLVVALAAGSVIAADTTTAPKDAKGVAVGEPHPGKGPEGKGHPMFEKTDTNKDGSISKDEWRTKGDEMFGEIDTNKDGKITQDEMKAKHEARKAEWEQRKAEWKAKHADKATAAPAAETPAKH